MPQQLLEEAIVVHNQMVKGPSFLSEPFRFAPLLRQNTGSILNTFSLPSPVDSHVFAGKEIAYDAGSTSAGAGLVKKIAARAFDLYEARGCQDGFDVQDWLQAEREDHARRFRGPIGGFLD